VATITFDHPIGSPMLKLLSLYMCPLQSHEVPHLNVQHAVKEICHPCKLPWDSTHSSRMAPIHLATYYDLVWSCSPCMYTWLSPKLLLQATKRPSCEIVGAQHAVILLPDPCFGALISYPSVPSHQKSWLHNEAVRMKSL
jgi:hypothetical protein